MSSVEVPKASKSAVERAEALGEEAAAQERRLLLEAKINAPLLEEWHLFAKLSESAKTDADKIRAQVDAEALGNRLAEQAKAELLAEPILPFDAAAAVDTLNAVEDEVEKATRTAQALVAAAKRKQAQYENILLPLIRSYAEKTPRSTKTQWKLPGTQGKIAEQEYKAKVQVIDADKAIATLKAQIPFDDRDEVIEIHESVKETQVRDLVLAKKITIGPGLQLLPERKEITYRRK